jgi:hypothetical protein
LQFLFWVPNKLALLQIVKNNQSNFLTSEEKTKKQNGTYQIPNQMNLVLIYSSSLKTSVVVSNWRLANVIHVFKEEKDLGVQISCVCKPQLYQSFLKKKPGAWSAVPKYHQQR